MKRILCLVACAFPWTVDAADTFVGVAYSKPSITASANGISATADANSDFMLKLGQSVEELSRYYATVHIIDAGSGVTTNLYSASYDGLFGQGLVRGFVGGTLGYLQYKENGTVFGTPYSFDKSGAAYGLQFGALFTMNRRTELELGYHHLLANLSGNVLGVNVKVERITYLGIGANFKF